MFYINMNAIDFRGQQNLNISPEMQRKLASGESFGALDKEKLKQDTAEFATKQADEVKKENFVFRTLRNLGVEDPKKLLKSVALTVATTIGVAWLGNKMSTKTAGMGLKVDEFLKSKKWYQGITKYLSKAKQSISNTLSKSKTISDIKNVLKKENMAKPKADMTRGYGRGFVSIFSLTPVDVLRKTFKGKSPDEVAKSLELIVGKDKAKEFAQDVLGNIKDNREFCSKLSNAMREHFGVGADNQKFFEVLKGLKDGKINGKTVDGLNVFKDVLMKDPYQPATGLGKLNPLHWINVIGKKIRGDKWKGIAISPISDWWPTNLVNNIGRKLRGDKWHDICKGNLGDSLIKFNAVNGTLADTTLGKLVQKSVTVPTESYSNFVNDKSGLGLFLCLNTIGMFNNMQDAPKGKKAATVADDVVGTIGSIAIATPLAFKTTYGLASLSKLKGDTFITKLLRPIGKFFHQGLGDWSKHPHIGKIVGKFGGAMRFALIMFVFSNLFRKPIQNVIHKIFGKPYDKAAEEKQKQLEAQQNAIIPELGITNKELTEKIQSNPKALEKLQSDPILAQQIANDPKLLLDLLDGKEVKPKKYEMSQANKNLIAKRNLGYTKDLNKDTNKTEANFFSTKNDEKKINSSNVDTATYIPSSNVEIEEYNNDAQTAEVNTLLDKADKALKNAEKFL